MIFRLTDGTEVAVPDAMPDGMDFNWQGDCTFAEMEMVESLADNSVTCLSAKADRTARMVRALYQVSCAIDDHSLMDEVWEAFCAVDTIEEFHARIAAYLADVLGLKEKEGC